MRSLWRDGCLTLTLRGRAEKEGAMPVIFEAITFFHMGLALPPVLGYTLCYELGIAGQEELQ